MDRFKLMNKFHNLLVQIEYFLIHLNNNNFCNNKNNNYKLNSNYLLLVKLVIRKKLIVFRIFLKDLILYNQVIFNKLKKEVYFMKINNRCLRMKLLITEKNEKKIIFI